MPLPEALRRAVRVRADFRWEYCAMREAWEPFYIYHVEHIIARQHGGGDESGNLALACNHCNLLKGPNLSSLDPDGRQPVALFHPRTQIWDDHFAMTNGSIVPLTATGRTTVFLLQMNAPHRVELRMENIRDW